MARKDETITLHVWRVVTYRERVTLLRLIVFQEPFVARKDETITLHVWRVVTEQKVWYEWCYTEPVVGPSTTPRDAPTP